MLTSGSDISQGNSGDVSTTDWERLQYHAFHIRTLTPSVWRNLLMNTRFHRMTIAPETWAYVGRRTAGTPLLPNLQELLFSWTSPGSTEIVSTVPACLRRLVIVANCTLPQAPDKRAEWEASFHTLLSTVFSMTPNLTTLHLSTSGLYVDALSSPMAAMQNLRTVVFDPGDMIDVPTLRILSQLPVLKRMSFSSKISWNAPVDPPFSGFNNLEELEMVEHPSTDHFYSIFSSPRLHDIHVCSYSWGLPSSFRRTCDAWSRCFPALQSVRCLVSDGTSALQDPQPILQPIQSLLRTQSMTCFSLSFQWSAHFAVLDADISHMATAWPRLTTLEIVSLEYTSLPPVPLSATSLFTLASRCPHLRTLRLGYVEIRDPTLAHVEQLALTAAQHRLESLDIEWLELDTPDVTRAARMIDRLFPHLHELPVWRRYRMEDDGRTLWDAIIAYQTSRRQ